MKLSAAAALLSLALLGGCGTAEEDVQSTPPPPSPAAPPEVVEYDLGQTVLTQDNPVEKFRSMPVQRNGVIGVPTGDGGPFPVVVVLHGSHPVCTNRVDQWPCDEEQRNYAGFEHLVRALAARGFVAMAPNLNPEYTLAFGEPEPGVRLKALVEQHLQALADGQGFGVELQGRVDMSKLGLAGHSRGGEAALILANDTGFGAGTVAGVLQVASPAITRDPADGSAVPVGNVLSACDADVINQEGQRYYEGVRQSGQDVWAISAWLEGANHNHYNSVLGADGFSLGDRPDCDAKLSAADQQEWLGKYAADFFSYVFYGDEDAAARIGADVAAPAPTTLYDLPARVAYLPPKQDRGLVFAPASDAEVQAVKSNGAAAIFCPDGYYTAQLKPERAACQRNTVIIPGDPALALLSWDDAGDALAFEVPKAARDASEFSALTMRAAVNPLSPLNTEGVPVTFTVRVKDAAGKSADVRLDDAEPALQFPSGLKKADEIIPDGYFTGRVPLTDIRIPLSELRGVNLAKVASIELVFDQSEKGSIYFADLGFVR